MGKGGSVVLRTFAKLNLCLDVLRKREDGFHEIDSLFQTISLFDRMIVKVRQGNGDLKIESNVDIENNIIEKIWSLVGVRDRDVHVLLEKNIPIGAGLGGGSSNAAGFLVALKLFGLISEQEAFELAKAVGSDVPFFLYGGTAIVSGKGEVIKEVEPLKGYDVDVYFPGFSISTKEAYAKLKPEWFGKAPSKAAELYEAYRTRDFEKIKLGTYNIFEKVIPDELLDRIEVLRSENPAALTGSGSAYFVLTPQGKYHFTKKGVEIDAFEED
ncbi:4-(cytidine 5'-diphospho)-2-C-methyl-D-erythritol kinase [Fervidobacterium islandicum]|uniref:4-(cytidine 5'-diphospho)-2-C-methyl-D-erythritol kinase n=1 Tax=Fervidobacterium islandicum TaxID=2423 RepID=UPI003A5E500D